MTKARELETFWYNYYQQMNSDEQAAVDELVAERPINDNRSWVHFDRVAAEAPRGFESFLLSRCDRWETSATPSHEQQPVLICFVVTETTCTEPTGGGDSKCATEVSERGEVTKVTAIDDSAAVVETRFADEVEVVPGAPRARRAQNEHGQFTWTVDVAEPYNGLIPAKIKFDFPKDDYGGVLRGNTTAYLPLDGDPQVVSSSKSTRIADGERTQTWGSVSFCARSVP